MTVHKNQIEIVAWISIVLSIITFLYINAPILWNLVKFGDLQPISSQMLIAGVEHDFEELMELGFEDGAKVPAVITLKSGAKVYINAYIQYNEDSNQITEITYKYFPRFIVMIPYDSTILQ